MSDYPMLISNKLHSFRNFYLQRYEKVPVIGTFCDYRSAEFEKSHSLHND